MGTDFSLGSRMYRKVIGSKNDKKKTFGMRIKREP
jgi:hypothetical protein